MSSHRSAHAMLEATRARTDPLLGSKDEQPFPRQFSHEESDDAESATPRVSRQLPSTSWAKAGLGPQSYQSMALGAPGHSGNALTNPSSSPIPQYDAQPPQPAASTSKPKKARKRRGGAERPKTWTFKIDQYKHEPGGLPLPLQGPDAGTPVPAVSSEPPEAPSRMQYPPTLSRGPGESYAYGRSVSPGATAFPYHTNRASHETVAANSIPPRLDPLPLEHFSASPSPAYHELSPPPPIPRHPTSSHSRPDSRSIVETSRTPISGSSGTGYDAPTSYARQSTKQLLTVYIEDHRPGAADTLADVEVGLSERGSSLNVDAEELVEALQGGPFRIEGSFKAFTMRDKYRQNFLVVEPDGNIVSRKQNLQVKADLSLQIHIEAHPTQQLSSSVPVRNDSTPAPSTQHEHYTDLPTPLSSDSDAHGSPPPSNSRKRSKRPRGASPPHTGLARAGHDAPDFARLPTDRRRYEQTFRHRYENSLEFAQLDTQSYDDDLYETSFERRPTKKAKYDQPPFGSPRHSSRSEVYSPVPTFSSTPAPSWAAPPEPSQPQAQSVFQSRQASIQHHPWPGQGAASTSSPVASSSSRLASFGMSRVSRSALGESPVPAAAPVLPLREQLLSEEDDSDEADLATDEDDEDDRAPALFTRSRDSFVATDELPASSPAANVAGLASSLAIPSVPSPSAVDHNERMPLRIPHHQYVRPADPPVLTGHDAQVVAHLSRTMQQDNAIMFNRFRSIVDAGKGLSNKELIEWYRWVHGKVEKHTHGGARAPESCGRIPVEARHVLAALTLTEKWYQICCETLQYLGDYGTGGRRYVDQRVASAESSRSPSDGRLGSERWTELLLFLIQVDKEWSARRLIPS